MTDGSIPEGRIVPIADIRLDVDGGDHPWHVANREAVDRHWQEERVRRPFLFNGTVMMHRGLKLAGGRISGISHAVSYAGLMYFVSRPWHEGDIWHLYATPVIVSRDNAILLTRMAERTANPGLVYSPSGSLDPGDVRDGACDLDANMAREVAEEVSLDLGAARADAGRFLYNDRRTVAVFRRFRFDEDARDLAARIDAHIARETEPEVVEAVIVRGPHDITPAMPEFMAAMVRHHFAAAPDG